VRLALGRLGLDPGPGDLLAGAAVALWAFATVAYLGKLVRRPSALRDDLRVLPGRSGLAAMTMGGMVTAGILAPFLPFTALGLIFLALLAHAVLALLLIRLLTSLPPAGREVNPTWHLSFVGFIIAAPPLFAIGLPGLAQGLFWATLPVALAIWTLSGLQFLRSLPPAPLRPLLAIHAAPAALLATVAALLGKAEIAAGLVALGVAYLVLLAMSARWLLAAGPTALWGAFSFPLAALATAALVKGEGWKGLGVALVTAGLVVIPAILWWVWKRWPGGKLAAATNAAEA
jgi:tellurite resistance protein